MRANSLPKASSNLDGRCERFIQTIKYECLHKFIIFGKRHLDYLVNEFVDYYNTARSSMVRDNLPPVLAVPVEVETLRMEQIEVKSHIGGLAKSFERLAEHEKLAREAAASNQDFLEYLLRLTELELATRSSNALQARIRQAGFPVHKDLDTFNLTAASGISKQKILERLRCGWIDERTN